MSTPSATGLLVDGRVEPGFEPVRDAFIANFERDDDYRECGAALSVIVAGVPVVDLWGGYADHARRQPWCSDTLINVYSTTKGIVAIAVAMLVDKGLLRYGDCVAQHWPEFAAAGKQDITVAQLLSHQAGLSAFREPMDSDAILDWARCCETLAQQRPWSAPGSGACYHALTWGYLCGELVRRASGYPVGEFVRRFIAGPLQADFFIGLPESEEPRVADMCGPRTTPDLSALTLPEPALQALLNPQLEAEGCNRRAWRAAEIPAANGQASARGIARIYGALANGGELDGTSLMTPATIAALAEPQRSGTDQLLGFTDNWALGVSLNAGGLLGPDPTTFGHSGWGGSLGCANPERRMGIGYVCNQMGDELVGDPRGAALCNAIFNCLPAR